MSQERIRHHRTEPARSGPSLGLGAFGAQIDPADRFAGLRPSLLTPGRFFLIGEAEKQTIQWIVCPPNGQAYNWHRIYDPTTGRYTQADPLRFVDGPSVYAYVGGSPHILADFIGLNSTYWGNYWNNTGTRQAVMDAYSRNPGRLLNPGYAIGAAAAMAAATAIDICMMAAPGNVAATAIVQAWANAGGPKDKCKWLGENRGNFRADEVKMTEKAWDCRRSRAGR